MFSAPCIYARRTEPVLKARNKIGASNKVVSGYVHTWENGQILPVTPAYSRPAGTQKHRTSIKAELKQNYVDMALYLNIVIWLIIYLSIGTMALCASLVWDHGLYTCCMRTMVLGSYSGLMGSMAYIALKWGNTINTPAFVMV